MDPKLLLAGAVLVLLSYLVGSIPWGLLIGKLNGIDIREHGSGNIGATNVRRVLGKRVGALCLTLDVLKGLLPVVAAIAVCRSAGQPVDVVPALCAAGTVAGHVWPFTLGFKGGKGVATTIGAILAVAPYSVILALLTWFGVFWAWRYVSLASICAALMLPASAAALQAAGLVQVTVAAHLLLVLLALLIVVRHRSNLRRLLRGEEYRFGRGEHPPEGGAATLPPDSSACIREPRTSDENGGSE